MAEIGSYGQFCPVSMAAEILCTRWTVLVLRELLCGSARFNNLRRGVPKMSPTLLSKRLKELEAARVIVAVPKGKNTVEYRLTEAGEELRPLVMAIGGWGQRWVETRLSLKNLDPSLLMWDMRRHLDPRPMPEHRCTIQFLYPELSAASGSWWIVVENGAAQLCSTDPGYEIDLLVQGSLRSMTMIWIGLSSVANELAAGHLKVEGDQKLARTLQQWLGLSPFAKEPRRVA